MTRNQRARWIADKSRDRQWLLTGASVILVLSVAFAMLMRVLSPHERLLSTDFSALISSLPPQEADRVEKNSWKDRAMDREEVWIKFLVQFVQSERPAPARTQKASHQRELVMRKGLEFESNLASSVPGWSEEKKRAVHWFIDSLWGETLEDREKASQSWLDWIVPIVEMKEWPQWHEKSAAPNSAENSGASREVTPSYQGFGLLAAVWYQHHQRMQDACHAYVWEAYHFADTLAYSAAVRLAKERRMIDEIRHLMSFPMVQSLHSWTLVELDILCGNPFQALTRCVMDCVENLTTHPVLTLISFFATSLWIWMLFLVLKPNGDFAFTSTSDRSLSRNRLSMVTVLLGVLSGLLSVPLVLWVIPFQEMFWDLKETGDPIGDALYYFAGVSLREELAKALVFVCFIPTLRRIGKHSAAIMVASAVGLGFAWEENIQYYFAGTETSVLSRFITANFLHLALTGLVGHALWQWTYAWKKWDRPLGIFLIAVLAHGLYNYAQVNDFLSREVQIVSLLVLAWLSNHFFNHALKHQSGTRQGLSPLMPMVLGSAALLGMAFNVYVWKRESLLEGIAVFGQDSVALGVIFLMFVRIFRQWEGHTQ